MTHRWPVHPRPIPGEALTSWLHRIADRYGITVDELAFDLGHCLDRDADLDMAAPPGFVEQLANRTGVDTDQLRGMSINGYTPWLLDDIEPGPDTFLTYTRQFSVLLPESNRRRRSVKAWCAWVPGAAERCHRACPQCVLESTPPHPYLLTWSLPLMLSCPVHGCWLEHHDGPPGSYYSWHPPWHPPEPREAPSALRRMDARTWQALTSGQVDLPRRRVHAGSWFRLLRTIVDELGATLGDCGTAQRISREVWQSVGYPVRAGQSMWRAFEAQSPQTQERTLEAAAIAMDLLESGTLAGRGDAAALFLPEPDASIDPGRPQQTATDVSAKRQIDINDALRAAIEDARQKPDSARKLFHLATLYRTDNEKYVQQVRANFAKLGIPLEHLSQ